MYSLVSVHILLVHATFIWLAKSKRKRCVRTGVESQVVKEQVLIFGRTYPVDLTRRRA